MKNRDLLKKMPWMDKFHISNLVVMDHLGKKLCTKVEKPSKGHRYFSSINLSQVDRGQKHFSKKFRVTGDREISNFIQASNVELHVLDKGLQL